MGEHASNYPWAGNPRHFSAVAMPNGDRRFGVEGPLVLVVEHRAHCVDKPHYISLAEAEELHRELGVAIRAFDLARALSQAVAARAPYPFRDHRTLAEIMADEGAQ